MSYVTSEGMRRLLVHSRFFRFPNPNVFLLSFHRLSLSHSHFVFLSPRRMHPVERKLIMVVPYSFYSDGSGCQSHQFRTMHKYIRDQIARILCAFVVRKVGSVIQIIFCYIKLVINSSSLSLRLTDDIQPSRR